MLRARSGELRTEALVRRLAEALQATGGRRRDDLLRIAAWRLQVGSPDHPDVTASAATVANAVLDHGLAERLAREAVAGGAGFPARLALAAALVGQGRADEAEDDLARLAADARSDDERWLVAEQRVQGLLFELGRAEAAEAVLHAAEAAVRDPGIVQLLHAERANVLTNTGRITEALALARPLVEGEEVDEVTRLRALRSYGLVLAVSGRAEEALALALDALGAARRAGARASRAPAWASLVAGVAMLDLGRLKELENLLEATPETADGFVDRRAWLRLFRGRVALVRGHPRTAAALLGQAATLLRDAPHGRLPWCLGLLAEAEALRGATDRAEEALARATELLSPGSRLFEGDVHHARVWVTAARGELTAATALALELADRSRLAGARFTEAFALADAVRLGGAPDVVDRLTGVAGEVDGPLVRAFAEHAAAVAAEDGAALDEVADAYDELGTDLHAAEASAAAAAAHRRSGLHRAAAAAARRTAERSARCEGARTPALTAARAPSPLTRREQEVTALAASGLSSEAIAKRLVVSVRTVEGHLYNAFTKLGVRDRRELTEVLAENG